MKQVTIYTDGACSGNPGPGGWGAILKYGSFEKELSGGERCYIITRIRKGDGEPMAYEETYIPQELCPDLQKYLDDNASLYDIYENVYMLKLNYGKLTLEAETPEPMVRDLLNMPKGIPVLKMICIFYLDDGRPLYYVRSDYIGNKYLFSTQIPR